MVKLLTYLMDKGRIKKVIHPVVVMRRLEMRTESLMKSLLEVRTAYSMVLLMMTSGKIRMDYQ